MVFFSPVLDVLLFSLSIVVVINIFYKVLVNQTEAKAAKERIKEINARIKEHKADKQKQEELFKEVMRENSRLMKLSFKPMIISFVIILIALPWVGSLYGDKMVEIKDDKGNLVFDDNSYSVTRNANSVTVGDATCEMPCKVNVGKYVFTAEIQGDNVKISPVVAFLPFSMPFVGDDLGWLGWYILSSILFMVVSRRFMKIYV